MRIAEVIGSVTLSRMIPEFRGASLKVVQPLSLDSLLSGAEPDSDTLVAWDEFGAGLNSQVGISEGGEAAQPFRPQLKPVDTYLALIIDQLHLTHTQLQG
ncbi:MAG: EutN/CcmL family microcompartment protein [Planctomycetales bacterium]|nr:EutN/CcmL family microcompartment protein [Planctomycetales bacterium]